MFIEEWIYQRLLRESQDCGCTVLGIKFHKIESAVFSKSDIELAVYDIPITKIIEENSVKEIGDYIDSLFLESLYKE